MMRCFGIEPPSRIQVVHQVNHHSDASACPTKYFDLIPCQVALRARDANGGGFVFDCSAHTRTCLLGNIIAYTPYAFDINNFVYAHLNNLAQEAPDVKPFEEMSPPEWASALEVTVKQFVCTGSSSTATKASAGTLRSSRRSWRCIRTCC
jgi:hypothetical protein